MKSELGQYFDLQAFWGCTIVTAHHIVPVSKGGEHIITNGVFVNENLHFLLHKTCHEKEVGRKLQKIANDIYSKLTGKPEVTGIIQYPIDFWDEWGNLLRNKGLLPSKNNQNNRRI